MKTFDVIALGELNVDLILNRIAGFPEVGKEIFARDMICTLGSSTAIFAANVSALGARTAFAGMIGRDAFGELVRGSLEARGVDTRYVIEAADRATGVTVVMSYGEDRANVTYPGAMEALRFADLDPEIFLSARHIHLSSLFMQPGPISCRSCGRRTTAARPSRSIRSGTPPRSGGSTAARCCRSSTSSCPTRRN